MAQSKLSRNSAMDDDVIIVEEGEFEFIRIVQGDGLGETFAFTTGHTFGKICKWEFDFVPGENMESTILRVKLAEYDDRTEEIFAKMKILMRNGPSVWQCDLGYRTVSSSSVGKYVECKFSMDNDAWPPESFGLIVCHPPFPSQEIFKLSAQVGIIAKGIVANRDAVRFKYSDIPKSTMLMMLENRDDNADVTFRTKEGQEIPAHRNILSAQSAVFKTMFATEMTEKREGVVELADLSGPGFKIFLKFVYTGELDEKWGDYWEEVVYAAGKYQVAALTDVCDILLPTLTTWENCLQLLDFAKLHGLPRSAEEIREFMRKDPYKMQQLLEDEPPSSKISRTDI